MEIITLTDNSYDKLSTSVTAKQKGDPLDRNISKLPAGLKSVLKFRSYNMDFNGYEVPAYDLYEISQAEDVDGIVKRAIKIKRALLVKKGWHLSGKNKRTLEYVKKRFTEIGLSQNMSMNMFIKNIGGDAIRYNNVFIRKYVTKTVPSGAINTLGKGVEKIIGYALIPPETVYIKKDKHGNPIGYMQVLPDGRLKEYPKKSVIHIRINPRSGLAVAPPAMQPLVDDVRALRRIEENVELLIEQHLFPLLIVSIGTDSLPATTLLDGQSEITAFSKQMEEMPPSGSVVVSHRHKFELLSPNNVLDVEKYLNHFKKRAYTSAGVSNLDMGEGEGMNRATADNASKLIIDDVKDYQNELKEQIEMYIINDILLEKFTSNALLDEHSVKFEWNEIDVEALIKLENHTMLKYQGNLITEDEMRELLGKDPINKGDRNKMFSKLNSEPSTASGAVNQVKNQQQPANQHGKKSGPTKRTSNINLDINILYKILTNSDTINAENLLNNTLKYILSLDNNIDFLYNYIQIKKDMHVIISNYIDSFSNENDKYSNGYLVAKQIEFLINNQTQEEEIDATR